MQSKTVDLKPNRDLIDPHFDGYKLSLDHLPVYQVDLGLGSEPDTVSIRDDQYTYQHIKAFGVHNYLYGDPWNAPLVYYVDSAWRVMKFDTSQGPPLQAPSPVYQIPEASELRHRPDRLNVTLHFTAAEWLMLGDGAGRVYLINTGNRLEEKEWKVQHTCSPATPTDPATSAPCVVLHSALHGGAAPRVEAVLLHVEKNSAADNENRAPPYLTRLTWVTLEHDDAAQWELSRTRQLSGSTTPDYAAVHPAGDALVIASQKPFRFVYDSLKPVETVVTVTQNGANGDTANGAEDPAYVWSQTSDDVTVYLPLPPHTSKPDVLYKLTADAVSLGVKNRPSELLQGTLAGRVDTDASTWTLQDQGEQSRLCLHLEKASPGAPWPEVVVGDKRGHLVADEATLAEVHERLAHLTSDKPNPEPEDVEKPYNTQELEDCDVYPDETSSVARYDGDDHNVTHQANLGSNQWLFNSPSSFNKPPCFCLRHDVDGLIWQPTATESDDTTPWEHVATFNAFGYVQASKQQKKFAGCSPDYTFAVIFDCARHVYIYRQPSAILSPLRNRKTGREVSALAKQQLVSLDSTDNVLGFHVTNNNVYILMAKALHMIKINVAETL